MNREPDAPRPPRSTGIHAGRLLLGFGLAVLGVLWLLEALDVATIDWDIALPIALIAVGAALLVVGFLGGTSGGLVVLGVVLSLALVATTVVHVPLGAGVGDRTIRPAVVRGQTFELGVGKLTIDLSRLSSAFLVPGSTRVEGHVGVGQLVVIAPGDASVGVHARAGVGDVRVFGEERSGFGAEFRTGGQESAPVLFLELSVGIGQVEVRHG